MKKNLSILLMIFILSSCSSVLLTGRKQLNLVSDEEINTMSFKSYNELIKSSKKSNDAAKTAMVRRVGTKIARAVEDYLRANGLEKEIKNFQWEYNLLAVNQENAFAMPGGKIVVYEGILPKTLNENGLAVVLGHEVAHVVAKHSAERVSHQMAKQMGANVLGALTSGKSTAVQYGVATVYGIGTNVGFMLPYSRKQELEADELGLIFMAMAGYNPEGAIDFWQRMSAGKSQKSDLMSTHPSDSKRIAKLRGQLPRAKKYYKGR